MKRIILLLFLLTALVSVPVSATQTEVDAIDAAVVEWFGAAGDYDLEVDIEMSIAEMELDATSPECATYAGWHLATLAIFNEWRFTESSFLGTTYMSMVQSTPEVQYACAIAL